MGLVETCKGGYREINNRYQNLADTIAYKIAEILPARYFKPFPWETAQKGILYKLLGVELIKRYIPNGGDLEVRERRKIDPKYHQKGFTLKTPTLEEILKYETYSRKHEILHTAGTLLGITGLITATSLNNNIFIVASAAWGAGNLYPVMIQRSSRARMHRVLERAKRIKNY